MTLDELYQIISERITKSPKNSYISSLVKQGKDRIIQKVGEEATEVIIAAKNSNKKEIVTEMADLWFHLLVMLTVFKLKPTAIFTELQKRKKQKLPSLS